MLHEQSDPVLLGQTAGLLRTKFLEDLDTIKEFVAPPLPESMTPADLDSLYRAQAYISSWLFTIGTKTSQWHRLHVEASALKKKRVTEYEKATFKFIVTNANDDAIRSLKSEAQKLQMASDKLDLDGTVGIEYVADLLEGYWKQMSTSYARIERIADAILTHLSILKSRLNLNPNNL